LAKTIFNCIKKYLKQQYKKEAYTPSSEWKSSSPQALLTIFNEHHIILIKAPSLTTIMGGGKEGVKGGEACFK